MTPLPQAPQFSVIVATRNRPEALEACLRSLVAQDFSRDAFEVLVVDDGSMSPQRQVVEPFTGDLHIRVIEQANAGPAAARNAGALAARGRHLAFTDDDCRPDAQWLSALATALEQHPRSAVGGAIVNRLDNPFSTASQYLVDFLYEYFGTHHTEGRFFLTSNCAVPAELFRELGGFDLTFPFAAAEDRDLCERWQQRGLALDYAGKAVVSHAHRLSFWLFCRQHFTYGRGAWFLRRARQRRGGEPLRVWPLTFYIKLVLFPFSKEGWPRAVVLSMLAALSQVAYVTGYLRQALAGVRPGRPPVALLGAGT